MNGVQYLLELDGNIWDQGNGFYVKIEVKCVTVSPARPQGIKYSLTLHNPDGKRVLGFDNAHQVTEGRGYNTRKVLEWDHRHKTNHTHIIIPYQYESAEKLLDDFFEEVDKALAALTE